MSTVITFLIGAFVGATVATVILSCCIAAKHGDKQLENIHNKE